MPINYVAGDMIYVPKNRIGLPIDGPSAFHKTTIQDIKDKSVLVDIPNGERAWVAKSAVHKDIGILVIRIGDFETEAGLLDPLTKSILQFFRVLVTDDHVARVEVRSKEELECFWNANHAAYSHVVITGHGSPSGLKFGVDGEAPTNKIIEILSGEMVSPKIFIFLACQTGQKTFAKDFSISTACSALIAPYHSVHGAESSLFCQALLTNHLLKGQTLGMAFKHASTSLPENSFRLWRYGNLEAGLYSRK